MTEVKVEQRHREAAANAVVPGWKRSDLMDEKTLGIASRVAQALAEAEHSALAAAQGEGWVACSERMPEHQQVVLFWVSGWLPDADPGLGAFVNDDHGQWWNDTTQTMGYGDDRDPKRYYTKGANANGVTHWMPLPPPPKAEGKP